MLSNFVLVCVQCAVVFEWWWFMTSKLRAKAIVCLWIVFWKCIHHFPLTHLPVTHYQPVSTSFSFANSISNIYSIQQCEAIQWHHNHHHRCWSHFYRIDEDDDDLYNIYVGDIHDDVYIPSDVKRFRFESRSHIWNYASYIYIYMGLCVCFQLSRCAFININVSEYKCVCVCESFRVNCGYEASVSRSQLPLSERWTTIISN